MNTDIKISPSFGVIFNHVLDICGVIAGIAILIIMILTGYQVASRYLINVSPSWITEMVNALLIYMTFLGAPWVLKHKGHIAIDIIYNYQKRKGKLAFDFIITIIALITCIILAWYAGLNSFNSIHENILVSTTFRVPRGYIIGIIPFGCLLLIIELIRQMIENVGQFKKIE